MSAFFNYAKSNKYIKENPAEGLALKVKKGKGTSYDKFTKEDLERIFTVEGLDGRSNTKPWAFWIPVLALFTGCRLEEIAQLRCSDIRQEDSIWFLDLVQGVDQSLNTESSTRKVPLHSLLVDTLGFIRHVEQVKRKGLDRVFPELTKHNDKYGHYVSKWFNERYLKLVGVKTETTRKVFHSLRHSFITNLQHNRVDPYLIASIVGHEAGLITIRVYGEEFKLDMKKEAVEKLDYGIDLSHLAQSRFVV